MRRFVIPPVLLLIVAVPAAQAEVIHLKNGDVIYADTVRENANSVEYEIGDNSFTIPKSRVESVEQPAPTQTAAAQMAMPTFAPQVPSGNVGDLLNQIAHGPEVDRSVLASVESRGDAHQTAIGYYIAARTEYEAGRLPDCRNDLETALRFDPQNPAVLNYYAAILLRSGQATDAISYAERAVQRAPDSADAWAVLGYAQFAANRLHDAVESWGKSVSLRADVQVQGMIDRAERERSAETNYSQRETGHFVLRYEGNQSSEAFREQLLSVLESDYGDLSREFESEPPASVQVVLYTNQAFFDVTRAPSWMGAMNDGTLRIPLQGLDSVTPELARILRHELTHSFVKQITLGRCPDWLNEGLAQLLEPRSLGDKAVALSQLYSGEQEVPLNSLEHGFPSFNGVEARLAYDESLAAAQYLRDHYGMSDIIRVLRQIGEGESVETSLRSVMHTDYSHLDGEIRGYLISQSGN